MRNFWAEPKQDVHRANNGRRVDTSADVFVALPLDSCAARPSDDAIQLDSCRRFEEIVVRTRYSVYELVVLSGDNGDVLVRGGRAFPEFRPARLAGSTSGGRALKVGSIDVGLHMELHADGESFVTSTIQAISRIDAPLRA